MSDTQNEFEWRLQERRLVQEREIFDRSREKDAAVEYAKMIVERDTMVLQASKDYGQMALRSVFLLNGGALVSLIALMGSIANTNGGTAPLAPSDLIVGFSFFVAGLVFTLIAMLLAYANFQFYSQQLADFGALANAIIKLDGNWPHAITEEAGEKTRWTYNGAIAAGLASVMCFVGGCVGIGSAIR